MLLKQLFCLKNFRQFSPSFGKEVSGKCQFAKFQFLLEL